MKTLKNIFSLAMVTLLMGSFALTAQAQIQPDLQYFYSQSKEGLNQFEPSFTTDVKFDGVVVRIGGANTLQFQGLSHDNAGPWQTGVDENGDPIMSELPELTSNFNLATSNLDLDVALAPGMRMHLRTYLSSQHHTETYVKGGYLQIDQLDFIEKGFMSDLMDHLRIKVGHMENNYGDNHFRRSDNGAAIMNPFVGNYLMDSFTTEVGGEVYVYGGDIFGMVGLTNGKLNQNVSKSSLDAKPSFLAKLGYDSQINDDLRVRLTASTYISPESPYMYLYSGDRAGSRYYSVLDGSFRAGRVNPGFGNEVTAIMVNPFVKFQGLEFYGVFESSTGKSASESDTRNFTQLGAELLYRFGADEDIYVGGRYNTVSGELDGGMDVSVDRINIGGGWFMTDNVLAKIEYVTQSYNDYPAGIYDEAEFNGIMIEAVVSF
ncbi:MAG: hypothetical protein ACQETE_06470 [Bacteroidota bacterium]